MPRWLRELVDALAFWLAWISGREYDALARRMGRPAGSSLFMMPADAPLDLSAVTSARELYPYFTERFQGLEAPGAQRSEECVAPGESEGG